MRYSFPMLLVFASLQAGGETVRLKATADIWLSDANREERISSAGKHPRFKIKSIQEMAAVRFDASPAGGREVRKAALFLHPAGNVQLHYLRVSTVNQDWKEGGTTAQYGPASGATYMYADAGSKKPWAWEGSCFADVIMTSGFSIAHWAAIENEPGGWVSVKLTPELIYAMVAGDTDGLAVMDGGTIGLHNNFIHSRESGRFAPYIEVELGGRLDAVPAPPRVRVEPCPERAHTGLGALKVIIESGANVFCWRLSLDGEPVPRWRVNHPEPEGPTSIYLEDLDPQRQYALKVTAVSPGGRASDPDEVAAVSSPALSQDVSLQPFDAPAGGPVPPSGRGMNVWALPGLVKVGPESCEAMYGDMGGEGDYRRANAVWDGGKVVLFGARGEYVSFQLCIENNGDGPLSGIRVLPGQLEGPGGVIGGPEIELFKNWYARNRDNQWQPAYCIPVEHGSRMSIPDPDREIAGQRNQTIYVDVYIPQDAVPGIYEGRVDVEADGAGKVSLPVELEVFGFVLPDRLSFIPELNAYHMPAGSHDYYRLAHQHRCVCNFYLWKPQLNGSGGNIRVDWTRYDEQAGPLLSGEAFKDNRRNGQPVEVMYLPYSDSWPTPLSKETYDYRGYWPGRGDDNRHIVEQMLKAPYIGDALSRAYKDAFVAVERQFIRHFREKGWDQTEMQCFFGGKNTHRTQYGSNMWWTTDEPYHWEDWLALQFFNKLWTEGRGDGNPEQWVGRADISRPQWMGTVLNGYVKPVYFGTGAFMQYRRCRIIKQRTGIDLRAYGSTNPDNLSNTRTVVALMNVWLNDGNAFLPWQTLGNDRALDVNDRATSGNAILVPGKRFGLTVVGDMRLKACRDGQQVCEYFSILADRYGLQREQVKAMVFRAVQFSVGTRAGVGADNADALEVSGLKAWQIGGLRRALAELIAKQPPSAGTAAGVFSTESPGQAGKIIDWETLRDGIVRAVLENPERAEGKGLSVEVFGMRIRSRVIGMDENGVLVAVAGQERIVPFSDLSPAAILALADGTIEETPENRQLLERLREVVRWLPEEVR